MESYTDQRLPDWLWSYSSSGDSGWPHRWTGPLSPACQTDSGHILPVEMVADHIVEPCVSDWLWSYSSSEDGGWPHRWTGPLSPACQTDSGHILPVETVTDHTVEPAPCPLLCSVVHCFQFFSQKPILRFYTAAGNNLQANQTAAMGSMVLLTANVGT